ncbi:MAG TPA: molybdenum cofactor guanylyltransferase [Actinomycetota bacterium]|nr:molybdenum cofactor guanylyltransferase [Actinomycetota bacterium]
MAPAGLILCGGRSRRMGTEKALLEFAGERLIDRVHARLAEIAQPIFFAPGTVGRLGPLPGPEVSDTISNVGPLSGIAAGLAASPHELLCVVGVDMPWCNPALFELAADKWSGHDAVVPRDDNGAQVLHAIYARSALPQIERALAEQRRSVLALLDDLDVLYLDEESWRPLDAGGRFALNINAPGDLARFSSG